MERLVFTLITAVLFLGIQPGTLLAEDELPVVDVSTEVTAEAEAATEEMEEAVDEVADATEAAVAEVEEKIEDAEATVEAGVEANAESAEVKPYAPQGEWDLEVNKDSDVYIRKIYEFLNDPKITKTGKDRSLEYEFKYFNHGAITKAQRYNREGQYYIVTWTNKGAPADYELRIDYRQAKTRDQVNTVKIPYPKAKGTFKGTFSITGDNYYLNGGILSWRISVVRNGVIVDEKKSFVW